MAELGESARGGLTFAPLAADPGPWPLPAAAPDALLAQGSRFWLSEVRVDLTGPEPVRTRRNVQEVVTPEARRRVGAFEFYFHPDHERVVVHHVRVWRDGLAREAAAPAAVHLLRREEELERGVYDGQLTGHMVIPDVRVGDVVDAAYSLVGVHPTLRGRFSLLQPLVWNVPVAESRLVVRAPAERRLAFRTYGAPAEYAERTEGGVIERVWTTRDTPAGEEEADAPSWWIPSTAVRLADAMTWGEVAALFRPHYDAAIAAPPPAALEAVAQAIEAASADAADRIAAALRHVQSELRYHSVSIGDGGFAPRGVDQVWAAGFGDCKDAAVLFTALLRRLGVEADPALVNTETGGRLDGDPPHAMAFNHCIVRVRHAGRDWWLDPTGAPQSGRLERLGQVRSGWALPLVDGAALTAMGEDEVECLEETHEDWRTGPGRTASLEARIVYRGRRADDFRRFFREEGLEGVSRVSREWHERAYGSLTMDPVEVIDRADDNEVEVVSRPVFDDVWAAHGNTGVFSVVDDTVAPQLRTPETPERRAPIALDGPARLRVTRTFDPPTTVLPYRERFDGPGAQGQVVREPLSRGGARQEVELVIYRRSVPAEEAPAWFDFQRRMMDCIGFSISSPVFGDRYPLYRLLVRVLRAAPVVLGLAALGGVLWWLQRAG